jgi:hypothetical protein
LICKLWYAKQKALSGFLFGASCNLSTPRLFCAAI